MKTYSLEVALTKEEIESMMVRYHFDDADLFAMLNTYESMLPLVKASAYVDVVLTEEDRKRYPFVKENRFAVVAVTLSEMVDRLQELYLEVTEVMVAYRIECLSLDLLRKAYQQIEDILYKEYGLQGGAYIFPGEKYEVECIEALLKELGQTEITMTENFMLKPQKSAVYLLELKEEKQTGHSGICATCSNRETCEYKERENTNMEQLGLIHLYSGDGKGKTTAAIGLTIRAAGAGKRVCFAQFLKGSKTSELAVLENLSNVMILRNEKDYGFYSKMADKERARVRKMHDDTLDKIIELIEKEQIDVLILDEVTYIYTYGAVNKKKLEKLLLEKPKTLEIVMTGRNPEEFLVNLADYHTAMCCKKHPFEKQIPAREGIEY